jgi:hypothetical protein
MSEDVSVQIQESLHTGISLIQNRGSVATAGPVASVANIDANKVGQVVARYGAPYSHGHRWLSASVRVRHTHCL